MTQADIADFATWTDPGTSFRVQYSLPLFHEIDMTVSEGYRRIPHGGIEVGGLLFGRQMPDGARIEAFRQIDCEHAQGPSFRLSERDIALLREQIASAPENPELGDMELLGWFIAHTRGPLQMTEAESRLFAELFRGPGQMTVLVKPEKFKPTLFTFLVRGSDGSLRANGTDQAIILPLPGRAGKAEVASPTPPIFVPVPAPVPVPVPPVTAVPIVDPPLPPPPVERVWRAEPEPELAREQEPEPEPEPVIEAPLPETEVLLPVMPPPTPPPPIAAPTPAPFVPPVPTPAPFSPPAPLQWDFDRTPFEQSPLFGEFGQPTGRAVRHDAAAGASSTVKAVLAILTVVILGAGGAYWFYQQMPPPVIQLTVEPEPNGVVISWPPDETSGADHAFVRVNDGPLSELPSDAKASGHYQVQAKPDNLKVEILAQHTLHNSRGIVRYIQPATGR